MIIVSEPSAKAARRVRVDRSSPACNRRVAARSDTPRQAQARQISVHTEVLTGIRPLRSPRDRPTPARRHQGHLRCRCRDGASATLDLVEPTQRRPGMRERGRTGRAHQPRACQIRARYSGDRRGTAGSHGDTDRRTPATAPTRYHRSAAISAAWRVKDSNLGRHQPTDLQTATARPERSRTLNNPCAPIATGPHTPMTVDRLRRIGAVCGPSQPTEQHSTTRCDADQRRALPLVSAGLGAVIRRPAWCPRRSCQSNI